MFSDVNQKVFYVHESVRKQIPKIIKVFKSEVRESTNGFSSQVKWTDEHTDYKLRSTKPAKGYGDGFLEVIYEKISTL